MRLFPLLFVLLSSVLWSHGTYQMELKPGVWHLVGVDGLHHDVNQLDSVIPAGWVTLREDTTGGRIATWDYIDETTRNNGSEQNQGDQAYSTLGVVIDPDVDSGIDSLAIYYDAHNKDRSEQMHTMMLSSQGLGRRADVRIDFQGSYTGEPFYIAFTKGGVSGYVLEGVFDPKHTQDRPAKLRPRVQAIGYAERIIELMDMNLSDNNTSALHRLNIHCATIECVNNGVQTGGRQQPDPAIDNITAYHWNAAQQLWSIYSSRNEGGTINDFNRLTPGKAYWVRIETSRNDPIGMLLGDGGIDEHTTYRQNGMVHDAWNLLSFSDTYLREVPSAVFVAGTPNLPEIVIRDNFQKNVYTSDPVGPKVVSEAINRWAYESDKNGSSSWKVRAYPASRDGEDGIVIISDEDFEISTSDATSLGGRELYLSGVSEDMGSGLRQYEQSRIDEYFLGIVPNMDFLSLAGKKGGIHIAIAGGLGSVEVDLSSTVSFEDVHNAVANALSTLDGANVVAIDTTFDDANDTLIVAASARLSIRDNTHIRLFDYATNGADETFRISYGPSMMSNISYGATAEDVVSLISAQAGTTGVSAHEFNATGGVMLASQNRFFQLQELGAVSRFEPVDFSHEFNASVRGAIGEVYSPLDLARAAVDLENDRLYQIPILTENLTFSAKWSPDFPLTGPLYALKGATATPNSGPEVIVGGVTRYDDTIFWRHADLTAPIHEWKDPSSRFNLFKTHKERGYWVYMGTNANTAADVEAAYSKYYTTEHGFSNNFDSGTGATSPTYNRLEVTIEATVTSGFVGSDMGAGDMPESVQLHIDGEVIPLIKTGPGGFTYAGVISSDNQAALAIAQRPYPKVGMSLYISNGQGSLLKKDLNVSTLQPETPDFHFDTNVTGGVNGGLMVDVYGADQVWVYDGNLSDASLGTPVWTQSVGPDSGLHSLDLLGGQQGDWTTISYRSEEPYYDLRLLGRSFSQGTSGEMGPDLYSDTRLILYAPVYQGTHMLSAYEEHNFSKPIVFSQDGQSYSWNTENGTEVDSGVQIRLHSGEYNATDSNTTVLVYKPPSGSTPRLSDGTPGAIDLQIDGTNVARVGYSRTAYHGRVFYVYHQERDQLYYGIFPDEPGIVTRNLIEIDTNQTITNFYPCTDPGICP